MSDIDAGMVAEGIAESGPTKAIAAIASLAIPIPGVGIVIALASMLANRGKNKDLENQRIMDSVALNSVLKPMADAALSRDYDSAVGYIPQTFAVGYDTYYYDISLAKAPATANAWYAAALGYAMMHDDPHYLLDVGRMVDRSERSEVEQRTRDPGDAGGE